MDIVDRRKIVVNLGRFYCSGRLSSRRVVDGVKEGDGGDHYFSLLQILLYNISIL